MRTNRIVLGRHGVTSHSVLSVTPVKKGMVARLQPAGSSQQPRVPQLQMQAAVAAAVSRLTLGTGQLLNCGPMKTDQCSFVRPWRSRTPVEKSPGSRRSILSVHTTSSSKGRTAARHGVQDSRLKNARPTRRHANIQESAGHTTATPRVGYSTLFRREAALMNQNRRNDLLLVGLHPGVPLGLPAASERFSRVVAGDTTSLHCKAVA